MAEYDVFKRDENAAANEGDGDRVAKALARAGVASRREVERLIEAGRVALNGNILTTPAVKIAPGDILTVDGEVVGDAEPTRLFRYHKPVGLVTSHNDPQSRPTVFGALPDGLPRLISVGRLDLNSEGLLLLTNDGALSRELEMPSSNWPRVYRARAFGDATQSKLDRLKAGVTVEGVKYGPIDAKLDKAKDGAQGRNVWITVTLNEGKNREVRRVLESLGLKVNRLLRLAYGPFALGDLAVGAIEEIGPRVIREQLAGLVEEQNMPKGDRPQFVSAQGKTGGRRAPTPPKAAGAVVRRRAPPGAESIGHEDKPKTEYKPGWAKPKSRPNPHGPSKRTGYIDRAKAEGKTFTDIRKADGPRGDKARGARKGKVFARADDVLPGQTPRGPVRASATLDRPPPKADKPAKRNPKAHGPRPSRPPERPDKAPSSAPFAKTFARPARDERAPRKDAGVRFDPNDTPYERARKEFGDRRPASARPSGERPSGGPSRGDGPRGDGPRPPRPQGARPSGGQGRPGSDRPKFDRKGPPRGPKPR